MSALPAASLPQSTRDSECMTLLPFHLFKLHLCIYILIAMSVEPTGCIDICLLSTIRTLNTEYRIPNSFYNVLLGFIFSHSSHVFYSFNSSFDKTNIDVLK